MKRSLCGANCTDCPSAEACKGCAETNGCPYGKQCFIAEYILVGGTDEYIRFKQKLTDEINALNIDGMQKVTELYPLVGRFVNLEYRVPSGYAIKFLNDDEMYLGAQVSDLLDQSNKTCFGVIAREGFILICKYDEGGTDAELITYKRR